MRIPLTYEQALVAADIPGCRRWSGATWVVPDDCAWLFGRTPTLMDPTAGLARLREAGLWDRLYAGQRDDVRFFLERGGALLGHPTAAGKTLSGLACAVACGFPTLVVGPAISRGTWRYQTEKWIPGIRYHEMRGTATAVLPEADVYFVNHEVLDSWGEALSLIPWCTFVLDEAHEFRGRRTQRMAGLQLARVLTIPSVVAMTGTPVWSRLNGLWQVLDTIFPGNYGTYWQFAARYAGADEDIWGRMRLQRGTNLDELRCRLDHVMRRLSKQELRPDLPPPEWRQYPIENLDACRRIADAVRAAASLREDRGESYQSQLVGALVAETPEKLKVLPKLLSSLGPRRLHIATQTKASARLVEAVLVRRKLPVWYVDGEQSVPQRLAAIAACAASPAPAYVVGTMDSVRQSIDCSALDGGVVLELPYTAEQLIQYEGRFSRDPAKPAATIVVVTIDNSLDSHHLQLCLEKLEDRGAAVAFEHGDVQLGTALGADPDALAAHLRRLGL